MKRLNALAVAQQGMGGQPQRSPVEQRMRQYDQQNGMNPDQMHVSPEYDLGTNYQIMQQHPTDANVMGFEQLYGTTGPDRYSQQAGGVSPFQGHEQNFQGIGSDNDVRAYEYLYGTGHGGPRPHLRDPAGYGSGEVSGGPSQHAWEATQRMLPKRR